MATAMQSKPQRMTLALFRSFCEMRPDEERWELIDGTAVVMVPPTLAYQWIAQVD